jgi:hypothetical protein
MQWELLDWLLEDGGIVTLSLIVAGLFIVQAVFTFLLWRKGDETYLFKFIVYAIAAAAILIADFGFIVGPLNELIPEEAWIANVGVFLVVACVAGGMQIYFFIRDTWLKKEGGKA